MHRGMDGGVGTATVGHGLGVAQPVRAEGVHRRHGTYSGVRTRVQANAYQLVHGVIGLFFSLVVGTVAPKEVRGMGGNAGYLVAVVVVGKGIGILILAVGACRGADFR